MSIYRLRTRCCRAADRHTLIVGRDPDLTSQRGKALRVLQELFDWEAGLGLRDAG